MAIPRMVFEQTHEYRVIEANGGEYLQHALNKAAAEGFTLIQYSSAVGKDGVYDLTAIMVRSTFDLTDEMDGERKAREERQRRAFKAQLESILEVVPQIMQKMGGVAPAPVNKARPVTKVDVDPDQPLPDNDPASEDT